MNIPQTPPEVWQVEVNGQIYEANFEELTQWIAEGALLPQDKVKRGNLRWLEAGKIPTLYGFFNATEPGVSPPVLTTTNVAQTVENAPAQTKTFTAPTTVIQNSVTQNFTESSTETFSNPEQTFTGNLTQPQSSFAANFQDYTDSPTSNTCSLHPTEEAKYVCGSCRNVFCKNCPKSFGGCVKVCPNCGEMCKQIEEFAAKQQRSAQYYSDVSQGFGFEDFGKALAYPFKFSFSLVSGAILFMVFTLGQSASGIGGMFMIASAIFSTMLANALTFGCLANTVDNMSQGYLDKNFMPSFDDFSVWDDVVHPFFLSIGAYIASFGLLIVLVIGMFWYTWNQITTHQTETINQISKQMKDVRDESVSPAEKDLTTGQSQAAQEEDLEELQHLMQEQRKAELESMVGKTPENRQKENQAMITNLLKVGIPFLILSFGALLWGLFYFPAACAVAGYTRSFTATINPLVGLDTIKRMGVDYVKILVMCLLLALMSGIIGGIINLVFAPFDLPGLGNLPAKAIGSLFTFYFSIVFSVLLGYALYKNSSRLNLFR
jgi:hypothetical protein